MSEPYIEQVGSIDQKKSITLNTVSNGGLATNEITGSAGIETKEDELHDKIDDMMFLNSQGTEGPFQAMACAMKHVIRLLMECKEEKLVEKTENFKAINELNVQMAEVQKNFAGSADSSGGYSDGGVEFGSAADGLAAGQAYEDNLETMRGMLGKIPGDPNGDIRAVIDEAIGKVLGISTPIGDISNKWSYAGEAKKNYGLNSTLWAGINGPQWRLLDSEEKYNSNGYDTSVKTYDDGTSPNYFGNEHKTEAAYAVGQLLPGVNQAVTQNTIIETTLNSHSKKIEAEFKFEMESYNSIVNLRQVMYQDHMTQGETHVKRLR